MLTLAQCFLSRPPGFPRPSAPEASCTFPFPGLGCLWPGEINFEGTNKPYERQITDQKRKLLDDIRRGIAGRVEIREGELESLIATRHKMGYMLNFDRANVLILSNGMSFDDFVVISVAAYPEPQQARRYLNSQCPIMHPYTD